MAYVTEPTLAAICYTCQLLLFTSGMSDIGWSEGAVSATHLAVVQLERSDACARMRSCLVRL